MIYTFYQKVYTNEEYTEEGQERMQGEELGNLKLST